MTNATIGCESGDDPTDEVTGSVASRSRGVLGTIAAVMRSGASLFADFLDRIVHGLRILAPVVLGACQSTSDVAKVAPPVHETATVATPAPAEKGPRQLGEFTITFYYVVGEDEVTARSTQLAANDNRDRGGDDDSDETELASITPTPDLVTLYAGGGKCEPIAEVSKEFAAQLALQGTGKLHDGRIVNIFGPCNCRRSPCFKVTQAQWGTSGSGRQLQPFRTIAVDPKVVKLGSLLYVPLLEGRTMPGRAPWGGYVHDGCVVADDTGGHIAGKRIDLFVGRKAYYFGLGTSGSGGSHAWARHVPVFDGKGICERKGRQISRKAASI